MYTCSEAHVATGDHWLHALEISIPKIGKLGCAKDRHQRLKARVNLFFVVIVSQTVITKPIYSKNKTKTLHFSSLILNIENIYYKQHRISFLT